MPWTSEEDALFLESYRVHVDAMAARFPGIAAVLEDEMALAMNGAIYHDAFLETVGPETEVCFIPRIGGG